MTLSAQVPLMRNPQGTEDVCVTCGKVIPVVDDAEGFRGDKEVAGVEKQDDNVDVGTTLDDTRRDGEHTTRDGVYRAGEENGCKDDGSVQSERDVSGLLADRMMRGWALLSEHCPRCVLVSLVFMRVAIIAVRIYRYSGAHYDLATSIQ